MSSTTTKTQRVLSFSFLDFTGDNTRNRLFFPLAAVLLVGMLTFTIFETTTSVSPA